MIMRSILLCIAPGFAITASPAASILITHNGTPPAAQAAIAHAASIWEGILVSNVPIEVTVNWIPMAGLALGITLPNGERDFTNAPLPVTWYASALANALADVDLASGEADFNIWFDSGANWYTGTDGDTPPGQYDLVSVALHEMGHGLGFVGLGKKEGATGTFGTLQAADFAPLSTDFPWPDLDSLPSIFDRYLAHALDGPLTMMPNGGTQLGAALTSSQVFFNGPIAMAENGGAAPEIYAPATFALGSSCVHLDEAAFPAGDPDELMTPFTGSGTSNHWPGPLCIAMLRDIGWTIAPDAGIADADAGATLHVFPVPAGRSLNIRHTGGPARSLEVLDAQGRRVLHAPDQRVLDIDLLPDGLYTIVLQGGGSRSTARFIKEH